jgi:hypothetical protein
VDSIPEDIFEELKENYEQMTEENQRDLYL